MSTSLTTHAALTLAAADLVKRPVKGLGGHWSAPRGRDPTAVELASAESEAESITGYAGSATEVWPGRPERAQGRASACRKPDPSAPVGFDHLDKLTSHPGLQALRPVIDANRLPTGAGCHNQLEPVTLCRSCQHFVESGRRPSRVVAVHGLSLVVATTTLGQAAHSDVGSPHARWPSRRAGCS